MSWFLFPPLPPLLPPLVLLLILMKFVWLHVLTVAASCFCFAFCFLSFFLTFRAALVKLADVDAGNYLCLSLPLSVHLFILLSVRSSTLGSSQQLVEVVSGSACRRKTFLYEFIRRNEPDWIVKNRTTCGSSQTGIIIIHNFKKALEYSSSRCS